MSKIFYENKCLIAYYLRLNYIIEDFSNYIFYLIIFMKFWLKIYKYPQIMKHFSKKLDNGPWISDSQNHTDKMKKTAQMILRLMFCSSRCKWDATEIFGSIFLFTNSCSALNSEDSYFSCHIIWSKLMHKFIQFFIRRNIKNDTLLNHMIIVII